MSGPFDERGIVLEYQTGTPERYLRFDPDRPPGDRWLHREKEFDPTLDREEIVDRYALPASDTYRVDVVEVPPGEAMRIGPVAATADQTGRGELVEVVDREAIPESWVVETTTLDELLE